MLSRLRRVLAQKNGPHGSNPKSGEERQRESKGDGQDEVIQIRDTGEYPPKGVSTRNLQVIQIRDTGEYPPESASTGKVMEINGGHSIHSVVLTGDGKYILAGGMHGRIRCWRIDSGKEVKEPIYVGSAVYGLVATQGWISGKLVTELKGHRKAVTSVDVSFDGKRIATGSDDKTARIWSLSTGDQVQQLEHNNQLAAAKFSPNGRLLATATTDSVWIFECESGRRLAHFKITVTAQLNQSVAWHHNSKHLFLASYDGHIHRADALTGDTLSKWRIHGHYNPRYITLASDSTYTAMSTSTGGFVSFWDAVTGKQIGSPINADDAMAISANHDLVTSTSDNIITVWNLRSILPAHYCNNTAWNLQADLSDLQRRYKIQSHKLRQITILTTEIDYRKRAVAIKKDKLAALRQELDQLPDLSHELAVARDELRWSQARTHDTHQRYSDRLRDFPSTVADGRPGLPTIHQCIAASDASAEKAIIRTLNELNGAIQHTSTMVSTYLIRHVESHDDEARSSAAQLASNSIPRSLPDCLRTSTRHNLPLYLPIASQACFTSSLHMIIFSWTSDKAVDEFIGKMHERVCKSESQLFAAGWRSLTSSNLTYTKNIDTLVPQLIHDLSNIAAAAGCAASTSNTKEKLLSKFRHDISAMISAAEKLGESIRAMPAATFKTVLVHPGQIFEGSTMAVDHQSSAGIPARGKVLCATRLGLVKETIKEHGIQRVGQTRNDAMMASTIVKATVVRQG